MDSLSLRRAANDAAGVEAGLSELAWENEGGHLCMPRVPSRPQPATVTAPGGGAVVPGLIGSPDERSAAGDVVDASGSDDPPPRCRAGRWPSGTRPQEGRAVEKLSMTALAREQLKIAVHAESGRSARTVYGGHEHVLRQTVIALAAGHRLGEHDNSGESTVQVLHGRVTLVAGDLVWEGSPGDLLVVPRARHTLHALVDSAVLLTVGAGAGPAAATTPPPGTPTESSERGG